MKVASLLCFEMESYIKVRTNFTFTTYWGVLESQQLTYYDSIDPKKQTVKGVFFAKNAKVSKVSDISKGIRHGIQLVTDKSSLTFDCMDANVCGVWFSVLLKASNSHLDEDEQKAQLQKHKKILGLDTMESYGKSDIVKSYKRLCLKEHPDKGGNVELFNQIKEAYNALIARQSILDELNSSKVIHFEAMIEKASGAGIGLIVAEDKIRKRILITRIDDKIKVVGMTEDAEGEIRPGDALIGIDEDDCSDWSLSRVRARLTEHRVPIGTVVHFTFERLIPVSAETSPRPDDSEGSYSPARESTSEKSPRKESSYASASSSSSANADSINGSGPYTTGGMSTPPRRAVSEANVRGVSSSQSQQKETVFRAAATFPSMNDIDEDDYSINRLEYLEVWSLF